MGVESSISSKVLLRLVISIWTVISLEDWVASESLKDALCEGGKCGDVMNDCYFWNDTKPCTDFQSECHETPVFNLQPFGEYVVDYDHQTLRSSSEFERTGNACFAPIKHSPKPSSESDTHVSRFEPPSFLKSNERPSYLAFLHYCSSLPNVDYLNPHSTCPSGGANRSYVALIIDIQEVLYLNLSVCQSHVIVPVELARKDRDKLENVDSEDKLKDWIRLKWNLTSWESCVECKESGGKCREPDGSFLCFCSGKAYRRTCKRAQQGDLVMKVAIAASGVGIAIVILVVYSIRKKSMIRKHMDLMMGKKEHSSTAQKIEGLFSSRRYTYKDIKRMTNSFREKLGQGGYGYVYKGNLRDGQLVAVKLLKKLKGDGEEFVNEVASISRTSHVNVVSLLGFCFEGSKRALVYEFMPNGSLEKFIFKSNTSEANLQLSWEILYNISLGIAQGLEYLHRGCNARILHFDIKPHNILLDRNYCPKISDFGLAKICPREESIVSMLGARGTAGYIAPELVIRNIGGVSHKSDVYSYGMMVLKIVGVRKNVEVGVDRTSEIYFPHWIHERLELQEELGLHDITNEEDEGITKKMIIISLWCIQIDPRARPSMTQVVEMLRGSVEALQIPPKPTLSSPSSRSPIATTDGSSLLQFGVTTATA
ncbi:LEAF RUST 10 DISEASE-RESISTANCE LOCUS RECEPTOR-LIKE PROTEIN KINASE-like 2.4 isoform X1 [Syzygium oleosum]|uniref:LEAF RUST 10 DISEASE-RESISTANCE LOCUS RECEPTOR-LIKE PROTEIN KINASE-like 2.4 isoform X1 n=1 Tax=Syzygium oleosum TaxID=219896 RepID=UPI0024BA46BF|nr:LEAF RUST 10 DISEASE-RESISTANCE LOCUS RECEPTOR-LIKE PROTEIN KINASE-like 2.4 isoform X1 [Syzygium oleosum]